MPRVKLFNEDQALGQALELFWEKGYEATSLSDLTNHLKIGKGSFYDTFGSKRELFDRCLSNYQAFSLQTLDSILGDQTDPVAGVKTLLDKHTEVMLSDRIAKGCFIANSTTELADDKEIQSFLKDHNEIVRGKLIALMEGSRYEKDSGSIADLVITQFTGISVLSKFEKDPERFRLSNEQFMKIFQ